MKFTFIKRICAFTALLMFILPIAAACNLQNEDDGRLSVYASIYPVYFLSEQIGGERANVKNILPPGGGAHGFEPTMRLFADMSGADMLVLVGLGIEEWRSSFVDILQPDSYVAIQKEGSDGNNDDHDHDDSDDHDDDNHDDDDDHEHNDDSNLEENGEHGESHVYYADIANGRAKDMLLICDTSLSIENPIQDASGHGHAHGDYDPHTWTSIKNMQSMAQQILQTFIIKDPDSADYYRANYAGLYQDLAQLDSDFSLALAPHAGRHIVVSHKAFSYMCRDYSLEQVAVQGLSNEGNPAPQRLAEIAEIIAENNISVLYWESDSSTDTFLTMLSESAGREISIEKLSPIETLSKQRIEGGEDYISAMRDNLAALLKGF